MTYNVFGGTLNPAQSINQWFTLYVCVPGSAQFMVSDHIQSSLSTSTADPMCRHCTRPPRHISTTSPFTVWTQC